MLVDVGGYRLYLDLLGQGQPTVVFDTGLGNTTETWGNIPAAVAEFTRACVYDRAGLGQSEAAPGPRTSGHSVDDLHTLLAQAAIAPPYVLVGHSAGGANAYLYACRYPREVAGLVLIDPGHPELMDYIRSTVAPELYEAFTERLLTAYSRYEQIDYLASVEEQRVAPSLPAVPLVVLGRGKEPPPSAFVPGWPIAQTERLHREIMAELATRSPLSTYQLAEQSEHSIHRDEPELVLAAIRQVVDAVRNLRG